MITLGLERGLMELKQFVRRPVAVMFTLALPLMMLVVFASIFKEDVEGTNVPFRQVIISGIIASAIMTSAFAALAQNIAMERHDGTLKRLAGTPMPKGAYFIGKIIFTVAMGAAQSAVMLAIGVAFFGLSLPDDPNRWLTFTWVFTLGIIACALLGIAYSRIPRDGKSAPAIVMPPTLFLQFVSGVFFPFSMVSEGLQLTASLFPLRWLASGMRYVFLPDSFRYVEPGDSWQLPAGALVLSAWALGAFVISVRTFRFHDER